MDQLISGFSSETSISGVTESEWNGQWITFLNKSLRAEAGIPFRLVGAGRWLALERYIPWWPRPVFGRGSEAAQGEFFMVLWEREEAGGYAVALPLVDGNVRGILRGGSEGWSIHTPEKDPLPEKATLFFVATGNDPIALVQWAMRKIAERLGTFRLRTEKPLPRWVDYLGWCTWDAFYLEVSEEKVLEGLASFKAGGLSPRVLILDGGWQDEKDNLLVSFGPNAERFPNGLKVMVDRARDEYGVKIFGVWHTLQGFWDGVLPDGELAKRYQIICSENAAANMPDPAPKKRYLVSPKDVGRFFDDYHRFLRDQGVSMVKVDNQASLDHFSTSEVPPTSTMRAYQYALQDSEFAHFQGEGLHCMSNTTDAVYHFRSANVWRSSQDFFPAEPKTFVEHIFNNALNAVWVQNFALPDWDMFQSSHPAGAFHAAARAISGGPIYVSDKPDSHDFDLLAKLTICGGKILRCQQPALPALDSIFEDGRIVRRVTKIVNSNAVEGLPSPIGVMGIFNCFYSETETQVVTGKYSPSDLPKIAANRFALHHASNNEVTIAERDQRFPVRLAPLGYELVIVSAIYDGVALFGLIDKFNGSRAIESVRWITATELELKLADGGRFGWYSEKGDALAFVDGTLISVFSKGALSWAEVPAGAPVTLTLRFSPNISDRSNTP
ncbi:MAG: alpha-galactosidase [Methylacidiphilales bacterium]|nr:alpha-galactosidase [Candidatus Methylacidiphilales bacterium]